MKPDPLRAARQRTNQALYWAHLQVEAWGLLRAEPEQLAVRLDAVQVERSYAGAVAFYLWSAYQHWLDELAIVNRIQALPTDGFFDRPCPRLLQLVQAMESDGRVSPDLFLLQQLMNKPDSWLVRLLRFFQDQVWGNALSTASDANDVMVQATKSLRLFVQTETEWDWELWQQTLRAFQNLIADARAHLDES